MSSLQSVTMADLTTALAELRADIRKDTADEIAKLNAIIITQSAEIATLKTTLADYEQRLTKVESSQTVTSVQATSSAPTTNAASIDFRAILSEEREREKRKNNLIFLNVPETTTSNDSQLVKEIISEVGISSSINFDGIKRLGKSVGDKSRPIVITVNDIKQKLQILKSAKKLRNTDAHSKYHKVYINSDLTKQQLAEGKILRAELKRRKDGGEDVVIRRGYIVPRE